MKSRSLSPTVSAPFAAAEPARRSVKSRHGLEFPKQPSMDDLGACHGMKMPSVWHTRLLGCYSVMPNVDEMCGVRINLYAALIARKGGGKNTAIRRAKDPLIPSESCSKFAAGAIHSYALRSAISRR